MGIYKRISKVIGIYISLCLILSCSENTKKYDDLKSRYDEMARDKQEFVEKSRKQLQMINDITNKLAVISKEMPSMRYNPEIGYSKMRQIDQINNQLSSIDEELKKARSGELENDKFIENLQLIVKSQKEEITILRTVNNAWVAFNANDFTKAHSLFKSSDESSQWEGARAFLNKALQLIAARNGECDNTAKSFLLKSKELHDSQEVRDLINKYH
jgi:predicted nuclease with TOPRIM domain